MYAIIIYPKPQNILKGHPNWYDAYENYLSKNASDIMFIKLISGQRSTKNERILVGLDHNLSVETLEIISNFGKK
jgi:hypothetical protein